MPFFAGARRAGAAGRTLLPFTTRTKPLMKPSSATTRRRRDLLLLHRRLSPSSVLFLLAISLFLILLFVAILRLGVPQATNSTPTSARSRPRILRRAPASHNSSSAAVVDLKTKDLYDKIEFLDLDGGAWKQGWDVKYVGNEWDVEKLKVFVVPHSHNDPGWKLTVEEYYNRQSRHILDTIVDVLTKDIRRKFIWEEMSYLERWWRDATDLKKESFSKLVKNGQLEIVGGGWVMNDEVKWWKPGTGKLKKNILNTVLFSTMR